MAKNMFKKSYENGQDVYVSLMEYRNTPLKDVGVSPGQLMLNKRIRTKIPTNSNLLVPKNYKLNTTPLILKLFMIRTAKQGQTTFQLITQSCGNYVRAATFVEVLDL